MLLLCSLISIFMVTVDWNGPCQSREGHLMESMSRQDGRRMCEQMYPTAQVLIPTADVRKCTAKISFTSVLAVGYQCDLLPHDVRSWRPTTP